MTEHPPLIKVSRWNPTGGPLWGWCEPVVPVGLVWASGLCGAGVGQSMHVTRTLTAHAVCTQQRSIQRKCSKDHCCMPIKSAVLLSLMLSMEYFWVQSVHNILCLPMYIYIKVSLHLGNYSRSSQYFNRRTLLLTQPISPYLYYFYTWKGVTDSH